MTEPNPPVIRWGVAGWCLVVGVFVVGFALFPLQVVGTSFDHLPGDLVDSRLNNYLLEHGYRWLTDREPSFWDVGMFYPAKRITAYSDCHLGSLPIYAAMRAVGLSPESAFQGWFLAMFPLNYAACVWAIRRIGLGAVAASAGGYLFAFGLPLATLVTQHAQLGPRFFVPPALVLGWELAWMLTVRRLAWLCVCLVIQAYLTLYIAYFVGLLLLLQWTVIAIRFRRTLSWRDVFRAGTKEWAARGLVLVGAVAAMLPLVVPYSLAAKEHGHSPPDTIRSFCPQPQAWVTPATVSWHREWSGFIPIDPDSPLEKQLFPGLLPVMALAAGIVALFRNQAGAVGVCAGIVLLAVALTTKVGGYAAYEPLSYLPGVAGMRTVSRIVLVMLFPLAVLVGWSAERIVGAAARRGRFAAVLAIGFALCGLIGDQWLVSADGPRAADWQRFRFSKAEAVARRDRVVEIIRRHPSPRLVCVVGANDDSLAALAVQLDAICAAQQLGLPTVNGWSGYPPPGYDWCADRKALIRWLTETNRVPPDVLAGLVVIEPPR